MNDENIQNKNIKQKLAIRIVCAVVTLGILIFSFITLGWFTNSSLDYVNSANMAAANDRFELAAVGSAGKYDSFIDAASGTQLNSIMTENSTYIDPVATNGGTEIKWVMSDESNMENNSGTESSGIRPGSHGKLSFYVISKMDGELKINFSLDTVLYSNGIKKVTDSNNNSDYIISNTQISGLVEGHIFFFENYDEASGLYSDRIVDKFEFDKNVSSDTAYRVDIYWIWPNVADQLMLPYNDKYLTQNSFQRIIANDDVTFYNDISEHPENYFYDTTNMTDISTMLDNMKKGSEDTAFDFDIYEKLNTQWNEADQQIGISVSYIELILTAG